jgi:hypothetical protein
MLKISTARTQDLLRQELEITRRIKNKWHFSTLEKSSLEKKCTLISNYIRQRVTVQIYVRRFEPFSKSFVSYCR